MLPIPTNPTTTLIHPLNIWLVTHYTIPLRATNHKIPMRPTREGSIHAPDCRTLVCSITTVTAPVETSLVAVVVASLSTIDRPDRPDRPTHPDKLRRPGRLVVLFSAKLCALFTNFKCTPVSLEPSHAKQSHSHSSGAHVCRTPTYPPPHALHVCLDLWIRIECVSEWHRSNARTQ